MEIFIEQIKNLFFFTFPIDSSVQCCPKKTNLMQIWEDNSNTNILKNDNDLIDAKTLKNNNVCIQFSNGKQ